MNLVPQVLSKYADLIDGLRSYYAQREGDNWVAPFSATLLVSLLFLINLAGIVALIDFAMDHNLSAVFWISEHRNYLLPIPVCVVLIHFAFAKMVGVYDRHGAARSIAWSRGLRTYVILTGINISIPMLAILVQKDW